jgi:hypothetical protein
MGDEDSTAVVDQAHAMVSSDGTCYDVGDVGGSILSTPHAPCTARATSYHLRNECTPWCTILC